MDFQTAISTCFKKFFDFNGRASRSEFWYWFLFVLIINLAHTIFIGEDGITSLVGLVLVIPTLAVSARRLHDIGASGWWALLYLVPLAGLIMAVFFFTRKGEEGSNRFGPDPLDLASGDYQPEVEEDVMETSGDERGHRQAPKEDDAPISSGAADGPWTKARAKNRKSQSDAEKSDDASDAPKSSKPKPTEPPRFGRGAAKRDK